MTVKDRLIDWRAALGALSALLLQGLFLVPFDLRPARTLLIFLALWSLTTGLWLLAAATAPHPTLYRRWRTALESPAMLLGLGLVGWAVLRWSFMLVPYAGRPWVIGLEWLGVGLLLGAHLGALDRASEGERPAATASLRRVLAVAALVFGLLAIGARANALPAFFAPSPWHLLVLLFFAVATVCRAGERPIWRAAGVAGVVGALGGLFAAWPFALFAPMAGPAQTQYWPLLFDHIIFGAGPGALTVHVAHLTSLGAPAAEAAAQWRFRVPAELGVVGLTLLVAFVASLFRRAPATVPPAPRAESRWLLGAAALLLALGLFSPALGRPEFLCWLGLAAGLSVALRAPEPSATRGAVLRLTASSLLAVAVLTAALTMTARHQVATRYHLRGWRLMGEQRWSEACKAFETAAKWQPDNPEHLMGVAETWSHAPSPKDASLVSPWLVRAGDLDPFRPEIHSRLAQWLAGAGRPAEAAIRMERALELDPYKQTYSRWLDRYRAQAGQGIKAKPL